MTARRNIAAQERLAELVNSGKIDQLDEVFAKDVVDHDPAPEQEPGVEGFKTFFAMMRAAFPDLTVSADALVADDDKVSIAYTLSGTHQGEFQGIAATDRQVSARGVQIARFDDSGKIVERWGSSDQLGILAQLGVAPKPA
ncbi:ester cyclase [Streptomyces sp. NPDC005181]|uniref:ester cyclase n=1 Tax=Streptomyces sp. NPDC005181 TaxID=3156869 RepID=UPI0033B83447